MPTDPPPTAATLRRLMLVLVLVGQVGLLVELVLLEHVESAWQWLPVALLLAALPVTVAALGRPSRAALAVLRGLAGAMVLAAGIGIYLHYAGNTEFELERDGAAAGWTLFSRAMTGATPALAPGALAQLGLITLLALYRHPLLARAAQQPQSVQGDPA